MNSREMTSSPDAQSLVSKSRGSLWTFAAAVVTFTAILLTICSYVFPRISGELISSSAQLEVRRASRSGSGERGSTGKIEDAISDDVLLTAADFTRFRADITSGGASVMTLTLNSRGVEKLRTASAETPDDAAVVFLRGKTVGRFELRNWTGTGIRLDLTAMREADANEIFARLTE